MMKDQIIQRKKELLKLQQLCKKHYRGIKREDIIVSSGRGNTYFYRKIIDEKTGQTIKKYLHQDDEMIPQYKEAIQDEYYGKMLKELNRQLKAIDYYEQFASYNNLEKVYEGLTEGKKKLVNPIMTPTDEYIRQWKQQSSREVNTYPIKTPFYTEQGEHVRSKSEAMIADRLFKMNIPYKYEYPLKLKGNIIYPDFTLLNIKKRREIYLEHLGKMDDPEYVEKNLNKIGQYINNGYCLGDRLIISWETSENPIDMGILVKTLKNALDLD